jgi:dUTP pyrophosphatase
MKTILLTEAAACPSRKTAGAGGYDLVCTARTVIWPSACQKIPTGVCVEIPRGYVGLIRPRSSAFLNGLVIQGTIDSDYRGEIFVCAWNVGTERAQVAVGDRLAQLIVVSCLTEAFEVTKNLDETLRGTSGFGSTGR